MVIQTRGLIGLAFLICFNVPTVEAGTITVINPNQGNRQRTSSTTENTQQDRVQKQQYDTQQLQQADETDEGLNAGNLMQNLMTTIQSSGLLNQMGKEGVSSGFQSQATMLQSIASHPVSRTMFNLATDEEFADSAKKIFESKNIKAWYISMVLFVFLLYLVRAWRQVKAKTFSGRLLVDFWSLIAMWIMVLVVLPRYWFGPSYFTAVGRVHAIYQKSTAEK